jgi:hypothetical protein
MNPRNRKPDDCAFWIVMLAGLILAIFCTGWYYAINPMPIIRPDNPVIVVPDNPAPPMPEPVTPAPVIVPTPEPVIIPPGPEPRCEDKTNA